MGGGVTLSAPTVQKLGVSAENIEEVVGKEINASANNYMIVKEPTWIRICRFTTSDGCSGRVVVQFQWQYHRENTCMFLFKVGWTFLNTITQFADNRCKKIRVVKHDNQPVNIAYIDILIDDIYQQESFYLDTEVFITNAQAYAGNIEAVIPEGYVVDEYDIT